MATSGWSSQKQLNSRDYISLSVNYTWGYWDNNQIWLSIDSTNWTGNVTGPKTGILSCAAIVSDGTHQETRDIYVGRTLFALGNFSSVGSTSGSCNGSITLYSYELDGWGQAELKLTLTVDGRNFVFEIDIPAPAITYGKPEGYSTVTNITQTTAHRYTNVTYWGANASAGSWSWVYGPGNYNYNSGGSVDIDLTNLLPDTTYNYKYTIWNAQGQVTEQTGTFKTLPYVKPTAYLSLNSVTNNSITMNYSSSGANVSQLRIYVNGNIWKTISASNSGTFTVTGLSPKTTYSIQIQAYTPTGSLWGNTTAAVKATTYPNPVSVNTNSTKMIEILPFSAKVAVTSSNAGDTASYGYTLLNANKGVIQAETRSTASTYNWTGLTPETTYYARVRVFTKTSGVASAYYDIQFTTPPDQASVFLKINNIWKRGKVFLKTQGSWIKSKYIYTKVNGQWRKNNNF